MKYVAIKPQTRKPSVGFVLTLIHSPAAWTTKPSVVVILELAALAASGSVQRHETYSDDHIGNYTFVRESAAHSPSPLCMCELPIWSTNNMKTNPNTRENPMKAWSSSWLCAWSWLCPTTDSAAFWSGADTSAWPWAWCPAAGGGETKTVVFYYLNTY